MARYTETLHMKKMAALVAVSLYASNFRTKQFYRKRLLSFIALSMLQPLIRLVGYLKVREGRIEKKDTHIDTQDNSVTLSRMRTEG